MPRVRVCDVSNIRRRILPAIGRPAALHFGAHRRPDAGRGTASVRLRTDAAKACLIGWHFLKKREAIVKSAIDRDPAGAGQKIISFLGIPACTVGAMLVAATAAAAGGNLAEAQARYQQDRAACISGQSHQDRATCLREAGAALQEAKRARIGDGEGSYEQNQLIRCDRVSAGDREDCLRRMRGEGTVSGSVEGGGIYRELRTTVPAQ
jgi:hypothetical protein